MATGPTMSDGATLYQQALANMPQSSRASSSIPRQAATPPQSPPARLSQLPVTKAYASASEEKAALAYHQARRAVDRHQSQAAPDAPIPYDALFPAGPASDGHGPSSSSPPTSTAWESHTARSTSPTSPPAIRQASLPGSPAPYQTSFHTGSSAAAHALAPPIAAFDPTIPEKERVRRAFEARDAAAAAAGIGVAPMAASSFGEPSYPIPTASRYSQSPSNGVMRTTSPPPDFGESSVSSQQPGSFSPSHSSQGDSSGASVHRQPPPPPILPGSPQPLTAAEEKARLRAQFDAEDAVSRSSDRPARPRTAGSIVEPRDPEIKRGKMRAPDSPPPPPPPLMPRPPKEYIRETLRRDTQTQEQLARLLANNSLNLAEAPPLPPKVPISE